MVPFGLVSLVHAHMRVLPPFATMSARDRRALTLGAAVIIVLLLGMRGVPAWRTWERESHAAATELGAEVERARAAVAALPAMRESLTVRRARRMALDSILLEGDSPAAVAAALSETIALAAEESGVRTGPVHLTIDSTGGRRSARSPKPRLLRVVLRTDVTGDVTGLAVLLAWLEEAPPLLAVRELAVTASEPGAPDDRPELLRANLIVEGLAHIQVHTPATQSVLTVAATDRPRADVAGQADR